MTWDPDRYEQWFDTPEGQFALDREARLLQAVMAGWPRRGRKLLEVGCGTGLFLEILWQMGFDVTGLDKSPEMTLAARKRFGNKAAIHLGSGEHMGFDDNEFDYAFIWSVLEFCEDPAALLAEAARVAEKGLIIGFLNKYSLYYLRDVRGTDGVMSRARWHNWYEIQAMVKRATGFNPSLAKSVLPGPMSTWKDTGLYGKVNTALLPPHLGAFGAARIDFAPSRPVTPLFAWRSEPEMS